MSERERYNATLGLLAERRALAEAATPGPWHVTHDPLGDHVENGDGRGRIVVGAEDRAERADVRNQAHIAACDPPTMLRVYAAAEGTLHRHGIADWWGTEWRSEDEHPPCGWCTDDDRWTDWPCPDALGVMDTWLPITEGGAA